LYIWKILGTSEGIVSPFGSGTILFKQSYDYGLCNDLSFHVGRFLEKEKLVSADFNQCNLLLLLPDPDPS
jgi:hypothetical protein